MSYEAGFSIASVLAMSGWLLPKVDYMLRT